MAEFRKFHVPNLLTEYENSGLLVFHFPIEDGMVPEDVLGLVRIFLLKKRMQILCTHDFIYTIQYTAVFQKLHMQKEMQAKKKEKN